MIEDTRQTNLELEEPIYIDCWICEENTLSDDMIVIHYRHVCKNCASAIKQDCRSVVQNCKFCGYEYPDYYTGNNETGFFICEDCANEL